MTKLRWIIEEPDLDEISVCPDGDDPMAQIVLAKRAPERTPEPEIAKEVPNLMHPTITKRSQAVAVLGNLAEQIAKNNPDMSPAEAYREAMNSERGREIRDQHNELEPEPQPVVQKSSTLSPEVVELNKRADEIMLRFATMGEPISHAEAYARAMAEEREGLVKTYYGTVR